MLGHPTLPIFGRKVHKCFFTYLKKQENLFFLYIIHWGGTCQMDPTSAQCLEWVRGLVGGWAGGGWVSSTSARCLEWVSRPVGKWLGKWVQQVLDIWSAWVGWWVSEFNKCSMSGVGKWVGWLDTCGASIQSSSFLRIMQQDDPRNPSYLSLVYPSTYTHILLALAEIYLHVTCMLLVSSLPIYTHLIGRDLFAFNVSVVR